MNPCGWENTCIYREKYGGDPYFHIFILQSTEVIAEKIMELPPPESGWNLCYQIVRITVAIVLCLLLNRCLEYGKKVCMNKKKIRGDET